MNILGIETSCDETAAAVVENGRRVRSNVIASSLKEHEKYGGIIPEIASRRQLELINAVITQALDQAKVTPAQIQTIAVTQEPGLIGSLLVGLSYARALSFVLKRPLIHVDHIQAHLYSSFLEFPTTAKTKQPKPRLPAVGLIVSGGHTSLFYIRDFRKPKLIGQTRDDAVGEAFDKVARILNLGYPGGPAIERLARKGVGTPLRFSCAEIPHSFDFSFSGIKTAVLYHIQRETKKDLPTETIAYAFQTSVIDVLVRRALLACHKMRVLTLLVGGGVAANEALRQKLTKDAEKSGVHVFFPPMPVCIDNAAMVAGLAYQLLKK